jgi:hypothetical protein
VSNRRYKISHPTGGLVDLALVVDMDAVRRTRRHERAMRASERAARSIARANRASGVLPEDEVSSTPDERAMHASLRRAWEDAEPGADKRAALGAMVAHEKRTGTYVPPAERRDMSDVIAVSSERWG